MKIKSGSRPPSGPSYDSNLGYIERVRQFCGNRGETLPIISRGAPGWDEWMEYFIQTGNPHGHEHSYARKIGRMTVPAQYPEMFDPTWRNRQPVAIKQGDYPPKPNYIPSRGNPRDAWEAERQREAISRMMAKLLKELGASRRKGGARDVRDAEAEKREAEEWLAKYQAGGPKPVSVSPKLSQIIESLAPPKWDAAE